jgi:hypothetical protein
MRSFVSVVSTEMRAPGENGAGLLAGRVRVRRQHTLAAARGADS